MQPYCPSAGLLEVAPTAPVAAGKATLSVHCAGEGPCQGTLQLFTKVRRGKKRKPVLVGTASFNLLAGASSKLEVTLTPAADSKLAKRRRLRTQVSGAGVATSTVTLLRAKTSGRPGR